MDGRKKRSPRGHIPATGLTVVFEPEKASLDIVFVHGFTGHPERTWASKKTNAGQRNNDDRIPSESVEQPLKRQKALNLRVFSRSRNSNGNPVTAIYCCWPRDLVPETVPSARVFTYGYDTHIRHGIGPPADKSTTVYDISWNFLVALESGRRAALSRPVLFVAHSLGGIIVKEMLRQSRGCRSTGQVHLRDIFHSTIGIVFFGTPHAGADPRGPLKRVAERVIKAAGFRVNERIVDSLLPTSERLRELRNEFPPMAQEQKWTIHSFQEQVGVWCLGNEKVVEDASSCLNIQGIETPEHIGRSHMEMCRFTGPDDAEYKKVAAALCRTTTAEFKQPMTSAQPPMSDEEKRLWLDRTLETTSIY